MKIYVKKIEGITLPQKGTDVAAGYDIVATSDPKIVGETHNSDETGYFWKSIDYIEYESNLFIDPSLIAFHTLIYARSSISKYNLVLANGVGLVDNDYRGMIICRFKYQWQPTDLFYIPIDEQFLSEPKAISTKISGKPNMNKIYKKGDKIAQLVIEPTVQVEWELIDNLSETLRGKGGFGSTGDKVKIISSSSNQTTENTIPIRNVGIVMQERKPVTNYESKVDIVEQWKKAGGGQGTPTTYEKLMREREKNL